MPPSTNGDELPVAYNAEKDFDRISAIAPTEPRAMPW